MTNKKNSFLTKTIKKSISFLMIFSVMMTLVLPQTSTVSIAAELQSSVLDDGNTTEVPTDQAVTNPATEQAVTPEPVDDATLEEYLISLSEDDVTPSSAPSSSAIKVDWTKDAEDFTNVAYYKVEYRQFGTEQFTSIETTETSVKIKNLTQVTYYEIRVITVLTSGQDTSSLMTSENSITVVTLPYKVSGLKAAEIYNTAVELKWNANPSTTSAVTYNIYRSTDDVDYEFLTTTTNTEIEIYELAKNTTYYFDVRACITVIDEDGISNEIEGSSKTIEVVTTNAEGLPNVLNLRATTVKAGRVVLDWNAVVGANKYRIYRKKGAEGTYEVLKKKRKSEYTDKDVESGTAYYYMVVALNNETGAESANSELYVVTLPKEPNSITVTNTVNTVTLNWKEEGSYTGFLIYKYNSDKEAFEYLTATTTLSYTDAELTSATAYRYKICAYAVTTDHVSSMSDPLKLATLPEKATISKVKAGNGKIRVKWSKVKRSTGYKVFITNADGTSSLQSKVEGRTNITTTFTSLPNTTEYTCTVKAYKTAFNSDFDSEVSAAVTAITTDNVLTNTDAYTYSTKKKTIKSAAWKTVKSFANYKKSYIIPGLKTTDCDGFVSTNMCPQGFCFAKKYAIISAYDRDDEENSVLYIIGKNDKKLKTVINLTNAAHVGGVCFDGEYLWVTSTENGVAAIKFSKIKAAATEGLAHSTIEYDYTCDSMTKASFITYRNEMLWIGTFEENAAGTLYSYYISRDSSDGVFLTTAYTTSIPSRVQGIVFSGNKLIFSRAYSYTHQLDIYQPKKAGKNKLSLGSLLKSVTVPYLCEDLDISGKFLYVNFESAVSPQAPDHMDRVVALKLKTVLKTSKK